MLKNDTIDSFQLFTLHLVINIFDSILAILIQRLEVPIEEDQEGHVEEKLALDLFLSVCFPLVVNDALNRLLLEDVEVV